jgi:hypothetical protein
MQNIDDALLLHHCFLSFLGIRYFLTPSWAILVRSRVWTRCGLFGSSSIDSSGL